MEKDLINYLLQDDETEEEGDETMKSEDVKRAVIEGMKEGTAELLKALRPETPAPTTETRAAEPPADKPMTAAEISAAIKAGVEEGTKSVKAELEAFKRAAPAGSPPGAPGAGGNGSGGGGGSPKGWHDGVFVTPLEN